MKNFMCKEEGILFNNMLLKGLWWKGKKIGPICAQFPFTFLGQTHD
jgi:hypothetical protein